VARVDSLVEELVKSGRIASSTLGDVSVEADAGRMVEEVLERYGRSTSSSTMPGRRRGPTATRSKTCRSRPGTGRWG